MDPLSDLLEQALRGDAASLHGLVKGITPVIRARVTRIALRYGRRGQDGKLLDDVDDLVHRVFVRLLSDDRRELRAWRQERGLSLINFVGLIAERETISAVRPRGARGLSAEEEPMEVAFGAEDRLESDVVTRDLASRVVKELRAQLGPRGAAVFEMLFVRELGVDEVCQLLDMKPDAVYAWRSRISKLARALAADLLCDVAPGGRRSGG